jgi:hypothetical protein
MTVLIPWLCLVVLGTKESPIQLIVQARVRAFIEDSSYDNDFLALQVQDPFQRLLLHGVCEVTKKKI